MNNAAFIKKNIFVYSNCNVEIQKQPPEVFHKKDLLKNFTIFTGKYLC